MSTRQQEEDLVVDLNMFQLDKLRKNRDKDWMDVSPEKLLEFLVEEVEELKEALSSDGSNLDVCRECADVANFAAMIASHHKV